MKIIFEDEDRGILRLRVESEDDLWALYNFLEEGDVVYARTTRELKTATSSRRKPMTLGLSVEKAEFQPFTTRLRIHGRITEGPKELDLEKQRHTINLDIGNELTIVRERGLTPDGLRPIREACRRGGVKALVVSVDDEEACVSLVAERGVKHLLELPVRLPGKYDAEDRAAKLEEKISEIAERVRSAHLEHGVGAAIVVGPEHVRKPAYKQLRKALSDLKLKLYTDGTSVGGAAGVREALRRGAVERVAKDAGVAEEERLMGELLSALAREDGRAAYALDSVERAVEAGAAEKVLVLNELVRAYDESLRRRVQAILKKAEERGAHVKIFSSTHETYHQLKGLGGIAAILRYKLAPWEA